ncbi:MAG: hypothetical protein II680_09320 [Clostridia bacterium]|nr:hypothetical protein [Clostridia bacterium]
MEENRAPGSAKQKKRPYLLRLEQNMLPLRPRYHVYRDGMNPLYTIEGDFARHTYSVCRAGEEILVLRRKYAKFLPEYTVAEDGREIARVKKGLFRSMSGRVYDKTLEIRVGFESYVFDIFVGGRKLCQIQQGSNGVCDCDTIRMYDGTMEEIAVALAVICDRASDKADSERYGN